MKQGNVSMILGILFGICLLPIAYICLVLGVVLAFGGNDWFIFLVYVFAGLGILTIVGSCFAKKKPLATVIINGTSSLVLLAVVIYLLAQGVLSANVGFLLMYTFVLILGVLSTIFAILAMKKLQIPQLTSDAEQHNQQ